METTIAALRNAGKPRTVYLGPKVETLLQNDDALSIDVTAFKHGGTINGVRAKPYVELTPELLALLRSIFSGA